MVRGLTEHGGKAKVLRMSLRDDAVTHGFQDMPRRAVGARRLRVEDRWLLVGDGEFVDDLELDGMLHARFARSPLAHARVTSVDVSRAAAAPGLPGAFAAADARPPPLRA